VVQILIDQLVEHVDSRPIGRNRRHQRRLRECVFQVVKNDRRLGDWLSVVDECRHHAVGIELEVGGVELVALQLEHVLPGLQTFFCQS
jgi:hypothetical protein